MDPKQPGTQDGPNSRPETPQGSQQQENQDQQNGGQQDGQNGGRRDGNVNGPRNQQGAANDDAPKVDFRAFYYSVSSLFAVEIRGDRQCQHARYTKPRLSAVLHLSTIRPSRIGSHWKKDRCQYAHSRTAACLSRDGTHHSSRMGKYLSLRFWDSLSIQE